MSHLCTVPAQQTRLHPISSLGRTLPLSVYCHCAHDSSKLQPFCFFHEVCWILAMISLELLTCNVSLMPCRQAVGM